MKQIKWGIIGCGNVTELKSGPAFNKVEGSKLVAVMRRDGNLAKDFAQRHQVSRYYNNVQALINDKEVNAIYIATPPNTHSQYAIEAMMAHKPVYVEKPMALNYNQCVEMVEVSKRLKVPLFVAYYRRTLPGYLKVKELIDEGMIGQVLNVSIQLYRSALPDEMDQVKPSWRVDPSIAGGGLFFDLASHQLDFLDFLFGSIVNCWGIATNKAELYKAEDTVNAAFEFVNGVSGTGSWCFVADTHNQRDLMEIIGTKGRIEFSGFNHHPIRLFIKDEEVGFPYINPENIQYNLIKQVVEQLQGKSTCTSTGDTAMRTSLVMDKIVKNYYNNL